MDEIIQKLLNSELLSEEVKAEVSTKWKDAVEQYKTTVREDVTMEVRAEFQDKWTSELETLVNRVDTFVAKRIDEEVGEFKADVENYRDLEAEYAERLVSEKNKLAKALNEEIEKLVDRVDAFLTKQMEEELSELKEDFKIVKQNEFGRKIYEAVATEFANNHSDDDSVTADLIKTKKELDAAKAEVTKLQEAAIKSLRESKLEKLLAPLNGDTREKMSFILQNVDTARLDEAFKSFIGRVLKDASAPAAAPQVVAESVVTVVTGDEAVEAEASKSATTDQYASLRSLAGIN